MFSTKRSTGKRFRLSLLCLLCLFVTGCNRQNPVEVLMRDYWGALARGDIAAAYALLSSEDQRYIDPAAFAARLRVQPALGFLLAPPQAGLEAQVSVEIVDIALEGRQGRVLADVWVPDVSARLGEELTYFLRGGSLEASTRLRAEQRLMRKLHSPVTSLPTVNHRYSFRVVKEQQRWRITFPQWRAEAMLASAKTLSADRRVDEAQDLLAALGRLSADLDPVASADVVREARRGRRMLPYLPRVQLSGFKRTGATPGCADSAAVQVRNTGDLPVSVVTGVVEFLDSSAQPVGRQTVVLQPQGEAIAPEASADFTFCLEPPRDWSGKASAWVSWLEFPEEVYKARID